MSDKNKYSEVKVGIFVFIAIALVISAMFWAKGFIVSKDLIEMKAYFHTISGMVQGDPVTVSGVKVGKVTDIKLDGDSVLVSFNIDKSIKIKKDYSIEIGILELMGSKQMAINTGKSIEEIDYTKPLTGTSTGDIVSMLKNVSVLTEDIKEFVGKLGKTNDNMNVVLENLNDIVGDKNLQKDLKQTMSNVEKTTKNLNTMVIENSNSLRTLSSKADKTLDNVNVMIDETSPEFKKTFAYIQQLTARVDSLVGSVNTITNDIVNKKSALGKFIYDDKFFDNLNSTLLEIEKLTKKIRQEGIKINLFN